MQAGSFGTAGADNCALVPRPGLSPPGGGGGRATGATRTPNDAAAQAARRPGTRQVLTRLDGGRAELEIRSSVELALPIVSRPA